MIALEHHFLGTYAKNLLMDWAVIRDMMHECTRWVRETIEIQEAQGTQTLDALFLTDQKIDDGLNGPYQAFFKPHLNAYATISKLETVLTLTQEDSFKESEHVSDLTLGLPNYLIERSDFSTLKTLREQLDTLTKAHFTEWQTQNDQWKSLIIAELKVQDIRLSDIELQDLSVNQPVSELHDRYVNLKITLPKLPKSDFDFQQYWTLKIILTIQSALNRMQLSNVDKEIAERLKTLKPTLQKIATMEKTLVDTQKQALQKLLAPAKPRA